MTAALDLGIAALMLGISLYLAWDRGDGTWSYVMAAFTGLAAFIHSVNKGFDFSAELAWGVAIALAVIGFGAPKLRKSTD